VVAALVAGGLGTAARIEPYGEQGTAVIRVHTRDFAEEVDIHRVGATLHLLLGDALFANTYVTDTCVRCARACARCVAR
jgi:hypothetical protein